MKVAIFSDPHHGLSLNDPKFHQISFEFYRWFSEVCDDHNVSEIWCAGDIFHNRKEINISTMQNAYACFDLLKGRNVKMIVGNHDAFYLDNSSVHSLNLFKNWPNMTIIDQEEDHIIHGRKIKFIPWVGKDYATAVEPCDCAIVHMELIGFEMNRIKAIHGTNPAIFEKCPLVISGHFHKHQDRSFKNTRIYYAGSPFEHNWGEMEKKYVHILDLDDMSLEKIENTISPKHVYIKNVNDVKNIDGNFVRVCIDDSNSELDYLELFKTRKPLDISFERLIEEEKKEILITDFKNVEIFPMIVEFIDLLNEDVVLKDDVKKLNEKIYEKNTKGE